MVINGPWFLGEVDPSIDLGVAPLPMISETGRAAQPYLTVEALQVSAQTAHPEAAWRLAQWLAAEPAALKRAVEGRQSVATLSVYTHPSVANDPVLMAFQAQQTSALPMPTDDRMAASGSLWRAPSDG